MKRHGPDGYGATVYEHRDPCGSSDSKSSQRGDELQTCRPACKRPESLPAR